MLWMRIGGLLMLLGVALGAFGAHALRSRLEPDLLVVFETGVRYHFYHALALFAVAWLSEAHPHGLVTAAGWTLTAGTVVFSGSLYLLSITGVRWWGAITPLGGTALLAGWALLLIATFRAP